MKGLCIETTGYRKYPYSTYYMEGLGLLEPYSHPSGNSSLASFLPYRILAFKILRLPGEAGERGYSYTLPIRLCAPQRGRNFEAPDLEWGIHFRGVF